jgi:hypothetical protein
MLTPFPVLLSQAIGGAGLGLYLSWKQPVSTKLVTMAFSAVVGSLIGGPTELDPATKERLRRKREERLAKWRLDKSKRQDKKDMK